MAPICKPPLLISSRSPAPSSPNLPSDHSPLYLPEIAAFNPDTHTIVFANNHTESSIDHIIFCTGYLYSFPFLQHLSPPVISPDGTYVQNLYQHIFYHPNPTLSFLALPQRIVPFVVAEAQAAVVARFLAGRLALPSVEEMRAWEAARKEAVGMGKGEGGQGGEAGKKVHVLGYPVDAEYINFLHDWAMSASPVAPGKGLKAPGQSQQDGGNGKEPPFWGEKECWVREKTPLIKQAARELGPKRRGEVRTLEELGFVFEGEDAG
jgi:hypothetical protein